MSLFAFYRDAFCRVPAIVCQAKFSLCVQYSNCIAGQFKSLSFKSELFIMMLPSQGRLGRLSLLF